MSGKEEISKRDINRTISVVKRFNVGDDVYATDYLKDWQKSLICLPWQAKLFKPSEHKIKKALNVIDNLNVEDCSNLLESLKEKKKELKEKHEKFPELGLELSVASASNWQICHPTMGDFVICKNRTECFGGGEYYKKISKKHSIEYGGVGYRDTSDTCMIFYVHKDSRGDKRIKFDIYGGRLVKNKNTGSEKWCLEKTQSYFTAKQTNNKVNPNIIVFKNLEGMEHFYQCKIIEGSKLIEVVEVEPMAKKV